MSAYSNYKIHSPIVLIGMMGVGKTTFGKKLAQKISVAFYDLDHLIEEEIGHSVSWIFENAGEVEFRKLETKKLKEILDKHDKFVLALGGGAFLSEENRNIIQSHSCKSVWLKASTDTIYTRVSYRTDRPLLEGIKDKKGHIQNMINERSKSYSRADFSVETDKGTHKEIVDTIIEKTCSIKSS